MKMRIAMALSAALSLISLTGCPTPPECSDTTPCPQDNGAMVCVSGVCQAARCNNGTLTCTGGKVCDDGSGACVNCIAGTNQGCASPAVCDAMANNGAGACVGCLSNTSCTGSTPVCNTGTQTCQTCLANNSGCSGATPVCDTSVSGGACVACTSNANCSGSTPACNTTSHTCVQCATGNTAACTGATPVCDFTAQTCKTCLADNTGCSGATPVCDTAANNGAGACVACKDNSTCSGATPACNTATHTCVACTDNTTCSGATPACNTATHTCVACNDNTTCSGATPVCDTSAHACVTCLSNGSGCSGATPVCDTSVSGGACVQCLNGNTAACTGATPVCDTAAKSCVTCLANNTGCSGNTPVCDTSVTGGTCVQCLSGQVGHCTGTTPVCDTTAKICKTCLADNSGCTPPLACDVTGNGGLGICFGCTQDNECTSPLAPVCNTGVTPGTCVQCMTGKTGACTGTTPVCDTTAMTCKTCLADNSGCSGSTPVCIVGNPGQCVQCADNTTCSGGTPLCDTSTHTCVECLDNTSCSGTTTVCKTSTHTCVQCTDNTTCSGGTPECDTAQNACVACIAGTNAGCSGATPLCLSDQTACVECLGDGDCTSSANGPICNTTTHTCGSAAKVMVVKVTGCTDATCATTAGLTNASAEVTLEEYAVGSPGAPVRSIVMPIAASGANAPLTMSGNSTAEGGLSRSADGRYVTMGGYAAAPATAAISGTASATVNRIIGRVDAAGTIDTTTHLSATGASFSAGNIRDAATTDGTEFWAVGNNTGVVYAPLGAAAGGTVISGGSTLVNMRNVNVFPGLGTGANQLYVSSQSSTWQAVSSVGTGTPTTAGQLVTILPGMPTATGTGANVYGFAALDLDGVPGIDTIYATTATVPTGTGILAMDKWTLNLGTGQWSKVAGFAPAIATSAMTIGVAATVEAGKVRIVAATGSSLVTFVDDGSNLTPAVTTVGTASTNSAFRGMALSPVP